MGVRENLTKVALTEYLTAERAALKVVEIRSD
jgi:hypothetical protein